jgi:hypothetical protein
MAHDVFISHSAADKPTADAVCAALEVAGIDCWIAPRNVLPGMTWSGSVVRAIGESRVMVLVFSSNSNGSQQVLREVDCAVNDGVVVVPFRIEEVRPSDDMKFYLGTPHWLDAITPPLAAHLKELCQSVQALLPTLRDKRAAHEGPPAPSSSARPEPQSQKAVPEINNPNIRPMDPRRPSSSAAGRRLPSRLFAAVRYSRFGRAMTVAVLVVSLLAVGIVELIKPYGSEPRPPLYAIIFSLALFPLVGLAASRRFIVTSRFRAFFLGCFCAVFAGNITLVILLCTLALMGIMETKQNAVSDTIVAFAFFGAIPTILVGLVRAFLMMPNGVEVERIKS